MAAEKIVEARDITTSEFEKIKSRAITSLSEFELETQSKIVETKKGIDEIVTKLGWVNKELEKAEALKPLLKLISGTEGEIDETIPAMLALLDRFTIWQKRKGLENSLGYNTAQLISSLKREFIFGS